MSEISAYFRGKRVLVTGGTGSIGSAIVRHLLQCGPRVVRILSRDEAKQFYLQHELTEHDNVRYLLGDVRDRGRVARAMEDIDIVFHAAALKHVPACEYNPFEAVETNVRGTQNVLDAALDHGVHKVMVISTDKAVAPINVMGATKLLAERFTVAANFYRGSHPTIFGCVRLGNVLGSRGSVVPLFEQQIARRGPVRVTDLSMTRFMMSIPDAVMLVLAATEEMQGGEIFILKMPVLRLGDLVDTMIEELAPLHGYAPGDIEVREEGVRPGEKMDEWLMTEEEGTDSVEREHMFVVYPELRPRGQEGPVAPARSGAKAGPERAYSSGGTPLMTRDQIRELLRSLRTSPDGSFLAYN